MLFRSLTRRPPATVIGRRVVGEQIDTVMVDDGVGVRLVLDHLASLGHRRIAHVDGGIGAGSDSRRDAFLANARSLGLVPSVVEGDFTEAAGLASIDRLMSIAPRPTAVFAGNDLLAIGVMAGLQDRGLRVPEDVSVVGFDNTFVSALRHVALTSVDQPTRRLGEIAVGLLHERLHSGRVEPRHETIQPTLVRRTTTGPAPA